MCARSEIHAFNFMDPPEWQRTISFIKKFCLVSKLIKKSYETMGNCLHSSSNIKFYEFMYVHILTEYYIYKCFLGPFQPSR
jgi:hypothetical protein